MLLAWFKFLPNLFPLSIIWHLTWGIEKYSPIPGINNGLFGKLQWHTLNWNFFLSPVQFQDTFVIIKVSTTLWTRHKGFVHFQSTQRIWTNLVNFVSTILFIPFFLLAFTFFPLLFFVFFWYHSVLHTEQIFDCVQVLLSS